MEVTQMATEALNLVNELAGKLGAAETLLEAGYAQFCEALLVVQKNRYWQNDFASWGEYFASVCDKFKLGSRQLYHKLATVKELDGIVEPADLTTMGISKASVLANIHKGIGSLPEGIIEKAKNPETTAKELKKALAEALHIPDSPEEEWIDLGYAFYVTPDEKLEIREAEKIARSIDPPISNELPDHSQKREIVTRFIREFLATYAQPEPEDEEVEIEEILDNETNS
jgi:hypothetical protein